MRLLLALSIAGAAVAAVSSAASAQPAMLDYVVKGGDTCDGIALRVYGDAKRIDLVHLANPWLGPMPHHLAPGAVLHLPPDASIAFVRNHVDAFTPGQHPGQPREPLMRGHRVSTYDASGAEVVFATDAVLQLGEDTLVVILGASHGSTSRTASASDTTLVNGSLRMHLAELAGRPSAATVSTPVGHHIDVSAGEAQVSVDGRQATRLAVYTGGAKLTAKRQTVAVPQGFGSKAEKDSAPTPPRLLPAAPEWSEPLPAGVLSSGPVDVAGRFGAGAGSGPPPARWHVQLSRDERYNDLVVDARVGLEVNRLEAHALPAGTFYARVSAIDADQFEGPSTPTSLVVVAPLTLRATGAGGQAGLLDLPPGLYCGIDGAPLAPTSDPLPIQRGPRHRLRCAADAEGHRGFDADIAPASVGPIHVEASLEVTGPGAGIVRLRVSDAVGAPLVGATLAALADAGATVRSVDAGPSPGSFNVVAAWPAGAPALGLHVVANGVDSADAPPLALPSPPPVAPRRDHLELAALAGAALSTSPYPSQPVAGPSLGLEIGWLHAFEGWSLGVAGRTTWEHGSVPLGDDLYAAGVPIILQLGGPSAIWRPYAGVEPALIVDVLHPKYAPVGFGGSGLLGVARRSADGEIFLELGYRVTSDFLPDGTGAHDAFFGHAGYRLAL